MNYLAHALLSGEDADIQAGNLMGDFIKGKSYLQYPEGMQQGMLLHRFIDHFTDTHPLIKEGNKLFKPAYRFSGTVFIDILFDHFLSNDPACFTQSTLPEFVEQVYRNLQSRQHFFNQSMHQLFDNMIRHNWLLNYREQEGVFRAMRGMCKRYPVLGEPGPALAFIETNYDKLRMLYKEFYPQLESETRRFLLEH